MTYMNL